MTESRTLPWQKPRGEWLVLALVALAAFFPVYAMNSQDNSRLCLAQAMVHGRLSNDGCFGLDRAVYHGHEYSDKAPGLSVAELPVAEALGIPPANELHGIEWRLWLLRLITVGIPFLVCAFLVGRVSEGLAPGWGSISLVTFALGTLVAAFAAISFDQVPAGLLAFAAFLLAWRGQPLAAGLLAGAGVLFEYQVGLLAAILALYVLLARGGWRALGRYVLGGIPAALLLGAYDWLAFGAPWHLSYRYVSNIFTSEQASGFFGIGAPHLHGSYEVFVGDGGLLIASPVLIAAVWGLILLGRTHRAEAFVCAVATAVFVFANCGYFLPYGGSPGPRFLVPALPFLALGLAPAFAWRPRLTTALALVSVLTTTARILVWGDEDPFRGGIWGEVARVPTQLNGSAYVEHLEFTVLDWLVPGRGWGAAVEVMFALATFVVALATVPRAELLRRPVSSREATRRGLPALALVVGGVCLVAAAEASAVFGYPYHTPNQGVSLAIDGSAKSTFAYQEVDFTLWASNTSTFLSYGDVYVTIQLPPGLKLLGPPAYQRGSGCKGTHTIRCYLDNLPTKTTTAIRFGVDLTQVANQTLTAVISAQGLPPQAPSSYTITAE